MIFTQKYDKITQFSETHEKGREWALCANMRRMQQAGKNPARTACIMGRAQRKRGNGEKDRPREKGM